VLRTCSEVPISLHTRNSICNVPKSWGSEGGYQYPLHSSHSEQGQNPLCQTSKRAYLYPSARAGVMGNFQYTLRRDSSWDVGFASRKARPEIPNLQPNFAKNVQNASNCGVSMMKCIVLWNSITCKEERWVVVHRHRVGCQFRERILVG